jgi:2-furoyl-CoA dehydrogenase large subunit
VAGTARLAAEKVAAGLARIAAARLNVPPDDVVFAGGKLAACGNPANALPFSRVAAVAHWAPAQLPDGTPPAIRETAFWTPPELTATDDEDRINSSLCHGFIFDYCGVEIDRDTAGIRIDRYVTAHDCGTILHPGMVDGQIRGGFAHALGAALLEEYAYGTDGAFLTGTFADYLVPTAVEVPEPVIVHTETPSPFTPLGAKGVGEGNCMSTPVCLANAVADALGVADVGLPLAPSVIAAAIHQDEPPAPAGMPAPARPAGARSMRGDGKAHVGAAPQDVWAMLLDPDTLAAVIPGADRVERTSATSFRAVVTLGIGPVTGRYLAEVSLGDLDPPRAVTLSGRMEGSLGFAGGTGTITLTPDGGDGTALAYSYEAFVGGKVASVGGRLLEGAARVVIAQFFTALARSTASGAAAHPGSLMARLSASVMTLLKRRAP